VVYGLSSLAKKIRIHLLAGFIKKAAISPQLLKDPKIWPGWGFEPATSCTVARRSTN